jgi:hypothetical protein
MTQALQDVTCLVGGFEMSPLYLLEGVLHGAFQLAAI